MSVATSYMTIQEAISRADDLYPNGYSVAEKVNWLSSLDARITEEILDTHEDAPEEEFEKYSADDLTTELIVPFPHSDLYIAYLIAKVDEANKETARYNNSSATFNALYSAYAGDYNRKHKPKGYYFKTN